MVPPRGSKAATAKAHLMEVAAAMARTRPWTRATLVSLEPLRGGHNGKG